MGKEFAFLFYVNDWAGGTQWLSRLQRSGYLDLLLYQVNNTCFSLEEVKKILGEDFENIWIAIKDKFIEENNTFYNKKMREVLEARINFTQSRRENRLGKTKKHKKNTRKTLVKQVEKEKEIERVKEIDKLIFPFTSDKFLRTWDILSKEKKWKNKSLSSLQMALKKLSEYPEEIAIKMIENAIAGEWQGIHEIKENNYGNKKSNTETPESIAADIDRIVNERHGKK